MEIGEVVWIQARIGDLFLPEKKSLINYSGFWGVVNQIYDPYHYGVLLYSGIIKVRTDNLESAGIPEAKWHKSRAIVERLNRLYGKEVILRITEGVEIPDAISCLASKR